MWDVNVMEGMWAGILMIVASINMNTNTDNPMSPGTDTQAAQLPCEAPDLVWVSSQWDISWSAARRHPGAITTKCRQTARERKRQREKGAYIILAFNKFKLNYRARKGSPIPDILIRLESSSPGTGES